MGYRIHTLIIQGKDPETIQREYGVRASGQFFEVPDFPVQGAVTPSGGYQLFVTDENLPSDQRLEALSSGGRLALLWVNETVMASQVWRYVDGRFAWSISHDSSQGIMHLETVGEVPAEIVPLREKLFEKQVGCDDVDYVFDVPVEAFLQCGGVRYDHVFPDDNEEPWERLEAIVPPQRRSWCPW